MPDEGNNILGYIPGKKSLKVAFIIYDDLECLLKKINTCSNNPDKSYTEKKAVHKPSGYSLVTCCSFDKSKNERKYYRGEDCMKMFCKDLKEQVMKIINYENKETMPLTDKEKESYENQKVCYICEKEFCTNEENKKEFKKMQKFRDHCHYTGKYQLKNNMAMVKQLKNNMTMVKLLKKNMRMVKQLKKNITIVKQLKNAKQLRTC